MVATAAIPIVTAVGEFAAPYLIREATKLGIKKFIQNYGGTAFQAISAGVTGGIIAQETPPLDLQKEKLFGTPIGSLPGMPTTYYDDTTEKDKEQEVSTQVEEQPPKLPEEPPKGPDIGTELATEAVIKTTEKLLEKKEKPKFGKLTKAETQTAKALKEDKPDFYSRAIESIKNAKPNKLTKTKWKSYIQSTKDEMDYLGLTEFLQGNESISKQELLKLVEGKDIAPGITVRSVPKDQMNPMYEGYSLGGDQEHIVFQIGKDQDYQLLSDEGGLFKSEHFDTEYGTGTFAHARVQVGFDAASLPKYDDLPSEVIEKLNNTLIIDEIQSDWIQKIQKEGTAKDWVILKGSDITKEFINENYEGKHELVESGDTLYGFKAKNLKYMHIWDAYQDKMVPYRRIEPDKYYTFSKDKLRTTVADSFEAAEKNKATWDEAVQDFPIKDSKKFVELVLNKMIEKAILDGRDSIAITNGQIQYNRYEAQTEEKRQGNKKFYDRIVYTQLEKIADKYNVELERIDISDIEQNKMEEEDQLWSMERKVKQALNQNFVLQKIPVEILNELANNRDLPGHASLYSNQGRGQGVDYILENLRTPSGIDVRKKINYYIWTKENISEDINNLDVDRDFKNVVWDMPIVPVDDATGGTPTTDLTDYTDYLTGYKSPEGVDLGYPKDAEQLIKMKLPKKLQKERLSKPIRLTKAKQQTERLFA